MKSHKFFICKHCGNLVGLVENKGAPLTCCGEKMSELVANIVEASREKHLPVAVLSGSTLSVSVGSAAHPMEAAHHIAFVYLETAHGGQRKALTAGSPAEVKFALVDDKAIAVYAYCNLHGLWKTEL